ncbi:DUF3050 domain-containing protein [Granulicella arctica]|uniref:DUF3050 domain-containing protein n=1 Tax=Granulicella arctica TaxID=940613 RepID=A0A7Y9TGS6_9BACT|nr:DUF3050 domain-containing protein [Granulicella arctica]NYF79105.1 hypothetical protein [Granulicella arctica]
MNSPHLTALEQRIQPLSQQLAQHRLYASFESVEDLRRFMESHVFAVWDFMCLLKALQRGLTCVDVPWLPSALPESRRLINEIVFGEESDLYNGQPLSHFELYRIAMLQCGADTTAIDRLLASIAEGSPWATALAASNAPEAASRFVETTFRIIEEGKLHAIAAAFTFGREDLIPDMFRGFLRDQDLRLGGQLSTLRWYMERHIEVDGDEHGPMALRMITELCGDDAAKWHEATEAAEEAINARIALWDSIANIMHETRAVLR